LKAIIPNRINAYPNQPANARYSENCSWKATNNARIQITAIPASTSVQTRPFASHRVEFA